MTGLVRALPEADQAELERARRLLESPGLAMQLANVIGAPIESLMRGLPGPASRLVDKAARKAVEVAFEAARRTLRDDSPGDASLRLHQVAVAGTGAVGGFFGLPGLLVELPVTTATMLRSIADIARSEGAAPGEPETRLDCLQVLALGGTRPDDDGAESGYFATRAALAQQVTAATRYAASGMGGGSAPAIVQLVNGIAGRFSIPVTQKALAQAAPLVGAATGATLNLIFMRHFQSAARGHFIVRRLERLHGEGAVRAAWARRVQDHPKR
ncbi:peptidase [Arenimonas caeni]|uniref:Peptidase n=1 Tax=Arenimonas caeni TaxID=2058085 RepID=A0A2P6MA86_9GAMM|nr:EcsC family protein [Arenimonas caeni]PRH82888.1 peptidase [Arenimonas caeni]